MTLGKSIQIYLSDGTVNGIRHGQITNWTGQAISCARTRFADLKDWPEIKRPGVYFLFGLDDQSGAEAAYIGEAEHVLERLTAHLAGKEFWSEVIIFTSKDDFLTKAHVKYLEARLVHRANQAGRYLLKNSVTPALPSLPRSDRDAMDEYAENMRTLVGVLGHRILEPKVSEPSPAGVKLKAEPPLSLSGEKQEAVDSPHHFRLEISGLVANAFRTDEGIVVLAGSSVAASPQISLSAGYLSVREALIAEGIVVQVPGKPHLQFAQDHVFSSPSQAAAVVVGYAINGREAWKTAAGKSWRSIEEASFNATK